MRHLFVCINGCRLWGALVCRRLERVFVNGGQYACYISRQQAIEALCGSVYTNCGLYQYPASATTLTTHNLKRADGLHRGMSPGTLWNVLRSGP